MYILELLNGSEIRFNDVFDAKKWALESTCDQFGCVVTRGSLDLSFTDMLKLEEDYETAKAQK